MNSFHLPQSLTEDDTNQQMRGWEQFTQTLNKQSQEGYNLFFQLHCELIWISPVDMVSGLERDRGITLIADIMWSHQLQDQISDEEWPGLVPSLQGTLKQWLASAPSFVAHCCLQKKGRSSSHRAPCREGQRYHLVPDFFACSVLQV